SAVPVCHRGVGVHEAVQGKGRNCRSLHASTMRQPVGRSSEALAVSARPTRQSTRPLLPVSPLRAAAQTDGTPVVRPPGGGRLRDGPARPSPLPDRRGSPVRRRHPRRMKAARSRSMPEGGSTTGAQLCSAWSARTDMRLLRYLKHLLGELIELARKNKAWWIIPLV